MCILWGNWVNRALHNWRRFFKDLVLILLPPHRWRHGLDDLDSKVGRDRNSISVNSSVTHIILTLLLITVTLETIEKIRCSNLLELNYKHAKTGGDRTLKEWKHIRWDPHLVGLSSEAFLHNRGKTVSSINGVEKTGQHMQKNESGPLFYTIQKNQLNVKNNLNVRPDTMKS